MENEVLVQEFVYTDRPTVNEYVQDDFLVDDDAPIIYETQTPGMSGDVDMLTPDMRDDVDVLTPGMNGDVDVLTPGMNADLDLQSTTTDLETQPSSRSSTVTLSPTPPRRRSLRQRERNQRRMEGYEAAHLNRSVRPKRRRVIDSDEEDSILGNEDSILGNEDVILESDSKEEELVSSLDTMADASAICADSYQDGQIHSHDVGMHLLFQYAPSRREAIIPETPQRERRSRGESERVVCRRMSRLL